MIRITYVTITYNAAAVLQRTLDSILQQDYEDIVHLIIDGASTDDTLVMIDDYVEHSNAMGNGHRIQVMSEPDKGIYDAMNKGLRSLDGDYVCFLNAGDFLPAKDTVSKIVEHISLASGDGNMPAVVYGDTDIVDGEGRFLHHRRLSPPEKLSWKSFRQGMLVCHQAFYARTDCHTLRYAVPLFGRCRLVYPCDEGCCKRECAAAEPEDVSGELYAGGTNNAPPPRVALGALSGDGASLRPHSDVPAALLVCCPLAVQIRRAPSILG